MLLLPRPLARLLGLALIALPAGALAHEAGIPPELPALPAVAAAPLPRVSSVPETGAALRTRSRALEAEGDFRAAAALRLRLLARDPEDVDGLWRVARDLVLDGNALALDRPDAAGRAFEAARDLARRGRAADPDCGECCLYEFAATARLAAVRGLARSLVTVRAAGATLEQCLAQPPTWDDPVFGSEAAHLYYGAAVFFRMLPHAAWSRWLGIEGDAVRAVEMARRAAELAPDRADYRAELGAALLCEASRTGDERSRAEGDSVLRTLREGAAAARARALLAAPEEACDSSAHGPVSWH
jgi:tetratricopeptide (TPR) repeat protein